MNNNQQKNHRYLDYIIVGAGPAGLQLAYYLQKNNRSYVVLEKSDAPGNFFRTFPRHKKLISINKVYTGIEDKEVNLRWDWNSLLSDDYSLLFKDYNKDYFPHSDSLVDYLKDYANLHQLNIKFNTEVVEIAKDQFFS